MGRGTDRDVRDGERDLLGRALLDEMRVGLNSSGDFARTDRVKELARARARGEGVVRREVDARGGKDGEGRGTNSDVLPEDRLEVALADSLRELLARVDPGAHLARERAKGPSAANGGRRKGKGGGRT